MKKPCHWFGNLLVYQPVSQKICYHIPTEVKSFWNCMNSPIFLPFLNLIYNCIFIPIRQKPFSIFKSVKLGKIPIPPYMVQTTFRTSANVLSQSLALSFFIPSTNPSISPSVRSLFCGVPSVRASAKRLSGMWEIIHKYISTLFMGPFFLVTFLMGFHVSYFFMSE